MRSIRGSLALRNVITLIVCALSVTALVGSGLSVASSSVSLRDIVTVHAAGQGKSLLNVREGTNVPAKYAGEPSLVRALQSGSARSLSMASDDLDGDGAPDLMCGYAASARGIITVQRGNISAFQTLDPAVYQAALKGQVAPSLNPGVEAYGLPEPATFLMVGDFDGDGRRDVLAAAGGSGGLYFLAGDGAGRLLAPVHITLGGKVTSVASGAFNRNSERPSVAVGIDGPGGPVVLIFEGQEGGVLSAPAKFPLSGAAKAVAFGKLDGDSFTDLAVAVGDKVEIIHGWGWNDTASASRVEEVDVPFEVRSLAIGDFIWDRDFRAELAVLSPDGNVHIFQRGKLDTRPFTDADKPALVARRVAAAHAPMLTLKQQIDLQEQDKWDASAREQWSKAQAFAVVAGSDNLSGRTLVTGSHTTGRRTDDLLVLDAQKHQIHILVDTSTVSAPSSARTPVSLDVDGEPMAFVTMPQKIDASRDLVVLSGAHTEAANIVLAPLSTFTVTKTADTNDGTCNADCSLREAINAANNFAGTNTISFSVNGTFTNTLGAFPAQGDVLSNNITILGSGPTNTVIANTGSGANHSVLYYGFNNNQTFKIQNLTLQNGNTGDGFGGGAFATGGTGWLVTVDNCVLNNNVSQSTDNGGAISQSGGGNFVIQNNTVISNNTATAAVGGGVCVNNSTNVGGLTVTNSTVTSNTASAGVGAGQGGGIWIGVESSGSSVVTISQSTITSNSAGSQQGGGIYTNKGTIQFCRIFGNTSVTGGSGVHEPGGGFTVTANNNWWGCNSGPGGAATGGCSAIPNNTSGFTAPTVWLQLRNTISGANVHNANQIAPGSTATFTADILGLSTGGSTAPGNLTGLATFPSPAATIYSNGSPSLGSINTTTSQYVNGVAALSTTFTSNGTKGTATVNAIADNQTFGTQLVIGFTPEFVNPAGSDATPFSSAGCGAGNTPCFQTVGAGLTNVAVSGTMSIQAGTYAETPNFNQNCTTVIAGNLSLNSITLTNGTFNAQSFTTTVASSNFTNNGGTFTQGTSTFSFTPGAGAQTIGGSNATTFNNLTINNGSGVNLTNSEAVGGTLTLTNGALGVGTNTLTLNGAVSFASGSFTSSATGTVNYNQGSAGQGVAPGNYGNLTFSNFNKTLAATGTIGVAGTFTPGTAVGHTITSSTFDFNGAGAQAVPAFNYNNLTISGNRGGNSVTLVNGGTIGIAGTFSPTATNNTYTTTGNTLVFNGAGSQTIPGFTYNNLTSSGGAAARMLDSVNTIKIAGTFTPGTNTYTITGSTIEYDGSGSPQVLPSSGFSSYNNLTLNNPAGTTGFAGLTVNGLIEVKAGTFTSSSSTFNNVQIDSGATLAGTNGTTINVSGNWTNNGTFTANSTTVTFNSTTAAQTINGTAATQTFNNLTVSKTGQTLSVGGSTTTLNINGAFLLSAGTFDTGTAATINVSGNWTNSGTFTPNTGTVNFNGSLAQTIGGSSVTTFNNLTINNAAGVSLNADIAIDATLTLSAGALAIGSRTLTLNNAISIASGSFTSNANGTVIYNQSLDGQNVAPGNYGNLTFSNFQKTLPSSGTVKIAGTFTTGAGGGHTIAGSTVEYNGASAQTMPSGFTTYNNLTLNNAAGVTGFAGLIVQNLVRVQAGTFTTSSSFKDVQIDNGATLAAIAASTINISGNWTNNGTFTPNTGTVNFNGSVPQTVSGTTTFNSLTINNAGGITITGNETVNGVLTLTNGNVNAGSNTLTISASGTISRTSGYVLGNLKKTFSATGSFIYHVGTANGYSPADVNVTAGTGDLTVKAVQGPQPILNASKSLQRYWTLTGSGITADLTFHYLDGDVIGNESIYRLIRVSGATAVIFPATPPTVDPANNIAFKTGVQSFSDWTAGEPTPPTAVELETLAATRYDGGTLLQWQTGSEVNNLGFNLYRDEGGKRVAVNSQMVAGSALVAGSGVTMRAGQSYAWWDGAASKSAAQYWLESVDLNGQSAWHGPFFSKFVGGGAPARGNSSMLGRGESAQTGLTLPVERAALSIAGAPGQIAVQSGLAGQAAVKMWVKREGFYKVTASELAEAGLDPRADTRLLQLYADGQQIPINVISDKDGLLSAIEFYGRGLDAAFTDQRVYWLVSDLQPGLRINQVKGAGQPTTSQSFLYTAERRDRTIYFSALRNGDRENFFGAVIAASPVDQSLTLQHVDQSASGTATVEVALQGVTTLPHKVWVYLNGTFAGEVSFDGQAGAVSRFNIAQSLLRSGDNQVKLVAQAGTSDISLVDYIRLSYWHSFTADDNALRLTAGGSQEVTISGFTSGAIRVLDVTDPDAVQELGTKIEQQKTGFAVTVASPGAGERRLLATTDDQSSKPAKIAANQPSSLRTTAHAADFVMIAPREFFSAIEPLRALRSKQGLKVELADIEDVFDEFSFGNKSPQAMKDFLQYAATSWKVKPRFVLLVGDASYDAKNYLGLGDSDLVPTRLIDTSLMETASDDWLADFNSDGIADLAVGRLAARTPAEASAMVRKIIGYENSEPLESMLLVADVNNGFDFESASTQLRALIPGNLRVEQINRGQLDDATAKSRLIDAITRGQKVVNYMGHGSVNLWSGSLLTNEDARSLTNEERLPLFVMMTCLNGYFHDPSLDSLAESLLKAENGGAVAVWTSTGMTVPVEQTVLNQQLYQLLFTSGSAMTLGEATARAKAAVTDGDVRRTWVLLGDPTMRLR